MGKTFGEEIMMTYYLLDEQEVFSEDKLIKIKPEAITAELKSLAQAAAQRENLKDVAVIFFIRLAAA